MTIDELQPHIIEFGYYGLDNSGELYSISVNDLENDKLVTFKKLLNYSEEEILVINSRERVKDLKISRFVLCRLTLERIG